MTRVRFQNKIEVICIEWGVACKEQMTMCVAPWTGSDTFHLAQEVASFLEERERMD